MRDCHVRYLAVEKNVPTLFHTSINSSTIVRSLLLLLTFLFSLILIFSVESEDKVFLTHKQGQNLQRTVEKSKNGGGRNCKLHRYPIGYNTPSSWRFSQVWMQGGVLDLSPAHVSRIHPWNHIRCLCHHQVKVKRCGNKNVWIVTVLAQSIKGFHGLLWWLVSLHMIFWVSFDSSSMSLSPCECVSRLCGSVPVISL